MQYSIYENRLTMSDFQTLRLASALEPLDSGMLKRALQNSLVRLSAENSDGVLGMLRLVGDGAYVFIIADLLVRPELRGHGIGSELVKHAVGYVTALLPDGRWGTVTLMSVKGCEEFYEGLGFHRVPRGEVGSAMQIFIRGRG